MNILLVLFRIRAVYKTIAIFILINFLGAIIYPVVSYAMLTNGPSQPETVGYQSAGSSDNVNMVTGSFYYNIPVTSIPEYPMSIGYSSGMGMDDEASSFGFGFNGFSGAINRGLMGLPDDISGFNRQYKYENDVMWDASVGATISAGYGIKTSMAQIGPEASVSFTNGYNNYTGCYGIIGISASIGAKFGKFISVGLNLSATNDSRVEGIGSSVGLNVSLSKYTSVGLSKSFNSSKVNAYLALSASVSKGEDEKGGSGSSIGLDFGNNQFSNSNGTAASYISPLSNVVATANSFGINLSVTIPIYTPVPAGAYVALTVDASYNQYSYNNQLINKSAYGYLYLEDYDRSNISHLSDMTVEGEDPISKVNRTNPVYLQKDFFNANCGGLSGAMQFVSENYGIVSRNKSRQNVLQIQLPIPIAHTDRTEVLPWYNVTKTVRNDDFDILSFLKSDPNNESSADFDNTMFVDQQLESFNGAGQKFSKSKMKLRFKGDLAGDFNLGSQDNKDLNPLSFRTINVGDQSGDQRAVFLGSIKDMPMARIEATKTNGANFDPNGADAVAGGFKTASRIDYYSIGDVLSVLADATKLSSSFYDHSTLNGDISNTKTDPNPTVTHNIISHLNKYANDASAKKLIADIRVTKTDGTKYIFNLPAFAKQSKQLSLSGTQTTAPLAVGNTDYQTAINSNRNKSTISDEYDYPYAWMLTAILGHDYIDLDAIPGPSDGDLGHWVKFKYVKVADNYRWRSPFASMEHNPGALHLADDDIYSVSTGQKEIYYLQTIESKNYIAKYNYSKRDDAIAAPGIANGNASNSLKSSIPNTGNNLPSGQGNYQFKVDQIDLYNKHAYANQSQPISLSDGILGKIVKSTQFSYDYSVSKSIPNNKNGSGSSSGKLTLTKVQHIAYDVLGTAIYLPSYQFTFPTNTSIDDPALNPAYDPRQKDAWGNFNSEAKAKELNSNIDLYSNYETINKTVADKNAKAFQLKQITLPTGGKMTIDYESGGYSQVQDKKCFVMRKIYGIANGTTNATLTVEVTDLVDPVSPTASVLGKIIKNGDHLYGEVAFYQSSLKKRKPTDSENNPDPNIGNYDKYIVNEQEYETAYNTNLIVESMGSSVTYEASTGRYFQDVAVKLVNTSVTPFYSKLEFFLVKKSDLFRYYVSGGTPGDKDSPLDAARKMLKNFTSLFANNTSTEAQFKTAFNPNGYTHYPHYSYLRTPVFKERFTGSRVKSITLSDEFQLSTSTNNEGKNQYITNYFYDANSDGTGVSSGVASIEPMGGPSSVIDISKTKGIGFYTAPAIFYGKVTVETGYEVPDVANSKYPRRKGKTQYQFYTPGDSYDDGLKLKFSDNFKALDAKEVTPKTANSQFYLYGILAWLKISFKIFGHKIYISIPIPLPLFVDWQRWDNYHANSYAYSDVTDLYGRPKRISQIDANGKEISYQKFNYAGRDETVTVLEGNSGSGFANDPYNNSSKQLSMRLGRVDQIWSESYYTKETSVDLLLLYMKAVTKRNFNFITMKQVYIPPILKSIETSNTLENFKDITTYTKFDYFTGQPIETISDDGNENNRISRTVPAYWKYPALGPSYGESTTFSAGATKANRLTEDAASYEYLSIPSANSLLAANVTQWGNDANYESSFLPVLNNSAYQFNRITNVNLKALYSNDYQPATTGKPRDDINHGSVPTNYFINNKASVFKPVRSYVFKADIAAADKTRGTFTLVDFNFDPAATLNAGWKLKQENTLFSKEGDVLESRNIINQYGSHRMCNNSTFPLATASNAQQAEMIFDGAENIYSNSTEKFTDNADMALTDALAKDANDPSVIYSYTINPSDLMVPNTNALILDVNIPILNYNGIIGRMNNVIFTDASQIKQLPRTLLICQDSNNELFIISHRGEPFNGCYILKQGDFNGPPNNQLMRRFKVVFDKRYMNYSNLTIDNFNTANFTTISQSSRNGLLSCGPSAVTKTYSLLEPSVKAHTGLGAFCLNSTGVGTKYQISVSALAARNYSAMVWVHSSSMPNTSLVMKLGTNYTKATLSSTAYAVAGDWKLLRVNMDVPLGNTYPLECYVENLDAGRAIYDDFRVQPTDAKMEASVYDPVFGRVSATLNNENMATWYTYDARGRLLEVKSEVQNAGPVTVKKYQYKDQKAD